MTAAKPEPPATLAGALAALQAAMPVIGKHGKADTGKYVYHYAPGEDITPKLYPLMAPLGLSFTAAPTFIADGHGGPRFVLDYRLWHVSGESTGGHYPLPDPDRYGPQDLGKAITYARRYALCALVGLFPGGDDNDAADVRPAPARQQKPHDDSRSAERARRAQHERLKADTAGHDPAKTTRTKGQQVSGTDDDPWASDAPVNGERAAQLRETIPTSDPEDKPGSILPAQHRAIERLLSLAGIGLDDRVERHQYVKDTLGLDTLPPHPETGEPSIMGLSYTQAADVMTDLQRARQ